MGGGSKSQGQGYSFASFLSYYFILAKVAKSWKSPGVAMKSPSIIVTRLVSLDSSTICHHRTWNMPEILFVTKSKKRVFNLNAIDRAIMFPKCRATHLGVCRSQK